MDRAGAWHSLNIHTRYRVAVNSFLAGGGDGYTVFESLAGHDTGFIDTQAFMEYVSTEKTLHVPDRQAFFQTP